MKKKLIGFIACFSFILAFGLCMFGGYGQVSPTVCHAASITAEVETIDTLEETPTTDNSNEKSEENPTFFGRLWEYVKENYPELITTVTGGLVFLATVILPKMLKKRVDKINNSVLQSSSTQVEIVDAVNGLIEAYNTIETELAQNKLQEKQRAEIEDSRYKAVGIMVTQTKAILEILATVYANSRNVPQGVKDLINLKYANALKTAEDNEKLKEVVVAAANNEDSAEVKEIEPKEE